MQMIFAKVLIILATIVQNAKHFIDDRLSLSFVSSASELESSLQTLGVDAHNLKCVCCNSIITDLDKIKGVYKKNNVVLAYCSSPDCELKATHAMLN